MYSVLLVPRTLAGTFLGGTPYLGLASRFGLVYPDWVTESDCKTAEEYRMKRKLFLIMSLAATSLWSIASASTVTYTFSGGGAGMTETTPYTPSPTSGSGQPITIYGEIVNDQSNYAGMTDDGGAGKFTGTLGLFTVDNGVGGNTATGIAPYNSGTSFTNQNGITESDVLLIDLRGVTAGSTISFVMETGVNATQDTGINVYTGVQQSVTPTGIGTGGAGGEGTNPLSNESQTAFDVNGNCGMATVCAGTKTDNFSTITGLSVGTGAGQFDWIAIQADCHYLLLDQIVINAPSGVPEPSFYGLIALAMVGVVIGARKMRARAAAEKA